MDFDKLMQVVSQFRTYGAVTAIEPLGNGLINDTYKVSTTLPGHSYVLQRINHAVFQDVDLLQHNIRLVTAHIRLKLEEQGVPEINRKVLQFIALKQSDKTYYYDGTSYWRLMVYIDRSHTIDTVTAEYAHHAGRAFGNFQAMLADLPETLGETIPNFHNMEFRLEQLRQAVANDQAGRVVETQFYIDQLESRAHHMCTAERLHREGKLPKRVCHCDTKVNNMLFGERGEVLCVIDLDTVMPSFVFSDFGDFLRTGACTAAEDEPNLTKVGFDMGIFRAFCSGYLQGAAPFITAIEKEHLPYAAALFPYMQCVRFLTDYLNGDTYYKIAYPEHNLVRTEAQFKLLQSVESHTDEMRSFISQL